MTQGRQILHREVASVRQSRVQARRCVSLGKDETVSVLHPGVLRIDIHFFKIKIRKNISCGQRAAGMSGLCSMNRCDDALADIIGMFFQF